MAIHAYCDALAEAVSCGEFVMTFFEAALEVLRTVQKPLDYKSITQFAISRNLLGHVGHTPDIVMGSCLLRSIERNESGSLVRLPNGKFALREWPQSVLENADFSPLPEAVSSIDFPPVNIGLLSETDAIPLLENDDIQFRKAVQMRFETSLFEQDDDKSPVRWETEFEDKLSQFDQIKEELNAQHNEHYNLCAAIVKILRCSPTPMQSAAIASILSDKAGANVYEQSIVLAMRADNALRVSRGKRAIFMHIPPDLWTLTENFLARHILKLESKLYDMSRQLRIYSIHALSMKLRELSSQAWLQLSSIILKHLNYTIISQCELSSAVFIFRAEEARGLTYIPVIIRVQNAPLVNTDDIIQFRSLIRELGYDHGVLLSNGEVSRDALNECMTKDLPIYAYSARQIAPIMLDAKIGVTPNELPIVFIDNNFFEALSSKETPITNETQSVSVPNLSENTPDLDIQDNDVFCETLDALVSDLSDDKYLFANDIDLQEL